MHKSGSGSVFVRAIVAAAAIGGAGVASSANIGFNPAGTGSSAGYTPTTVWTNLPDSALSVGFNPLLLVPANSAPYDFRFIAQSRVGQFQDANGIVVPGGPAFVLNGNYEVTKVLSIDARVLSNNGSNGAFGIGNQPQVVDVDPLHPGAQQFLMFIDPIGDGSKAVPGDGAGTVNCYGTGALPCASPDGTPIMSAHITSASTGSFDFVNGTGSATLTFAVDFVESAYLNIPAGTPFVETMALSVPSLFQPDTMWDGTLTSTGIIIQNAIEADSVQLYALSSTLALPAAAAEPSALALTALGLLALGVGKRRRRRTTRSDPVQ